MTPKERFDQKVEEFRQGGCSPEEATTQAINHFKASANSADQILNYIHQIELNRRLGK